MFVKVISRNEFAGYKCVAISEFTRVENKTLIYGDREYLLRLADGRVTRQVFKKEVWEKLENASVPIV